MQKRPGVGVRNNQPKTEALTAEQVNLLVGLFSNGRYQEMEASARAMLDQLPNAGFAWKALGTALRAQGKDALHALKKAATLLPDDADVFNNLGNALLDVRQFDAAAANYRQALKLKPTLIEAHCNLGNVLRNLGQLEAAAASCRKALQMNPAYVNAHNNLGTVLHDLGQLDQAVASYHRSLTLVPDLAASYNNLGNSQQDLGQLDDASASYRHALQINPVYADAYMNLGNVQRKFGWVADAELSCRKALACDPNSTAALGFMAELEVDKGGFADAEILLRRVIAADPTSVEAWSGLARTHKMTSDDADWLTEVQEIAKHNLSPRKEVLLRYAMGKYFDDVNSFEQAFRNYKRANDLTKSYGARYDKRQQSQITERICSVYDREWIAKQQPYGRLSARPIFIVGMPRSGTSLAEQILASHSSVVGAGELPFWSDASATIAPLCVNGQALGEPLRQLADDYLRLLDRFSVDALRVIDKMPANFLFLGLIHAAFPNARIIHMQRNPVDTCLSIYFQRFETVHSYASDLDDLAHYFTEYTRVMRHWDATLPSNALLHVPYEALVDDVEAWSRKMVEFIGLPWEAGCLNFHQNARSVSTASNWQVRQKISKSSVQRWRNYEKFLGPLLKLAT